MASRTIKIACAAAMLAPLAFVSPASAWDAPAENDCSGPYGAITQEPSPNEDCVGLDLRDGDAPSGGPDAGDLYSVEATEVIVDGGPGPGNTVTQAFCNGPVGNRDLAVQWTGPQVATAFIEEGGRTVGAVNTNAAAFTLICLNDR